MTSGSSPIIYPTYCHSVSPTLPQWCPLHAADIHRLKDVGVVLPEEVPAGWQPRIYKLYHHGNHPIKWIKIVGVVVAMDEFYGRKIYTLDDSSGACVECTAVTPAVKVTDTTAIPGHLDQKPRRLDTMAATNAKDKAPKYTKGKGKENEKEQAEGTKTTEQSVLTPIVPWDDIDVGTVVKIKGRVGNFRDMMQVQIVSALVMKTTDREVSFWNEATSFKRDVLGKEWVVSDEAAEKLRRKLNKKSKKGAKGEILKGVGEKELKLKRKISEEEPDDDRNAAKRLLQRETIRRRQKQAQDEEDRNAAKRLLELEMEKRLEEEEKRQKKETEDAIQQKKDALAKEERRRKRKGPEDLRNRIRHPPLALRKATARKYDLLGI